MEQRYFNNPYEDYKGQPVEVDEKYVRKLIHSYVKQIIENTQSGDSRGDLYVGDAGLQEADGNFPIALGSAKKRNTEKRLVHWCHGAPGAIYFLLKAYKMFKHIKYLDACKKAADLIWEKGLLKKGPGICHGVSGNGYAFLMLYKVTQEPIYLYRAIRFAEFLTTSQFIDEANEPDRPYSLYEGMSGTVCFLIDLLHIVEADFPFLSISI